ncbi:hypothetical protein BaRGS_00011399, partial [Batillaria attramentaria]
EILEQRLNGNDRRQELQAAFPLLTSLTSPHPLCPYIPVARKASIHHHYHDNYSREGGGTQHSKDPGHSWTGTQDRHCCSVWKIVPFLKA